MYLLDHLPILLHPCLERILAQERIVVQWRTDITMDEPAVCRASDRPSNAHQAMLSRTREQTANRGRVSLHSSISANTENDVKRVHTPGPRFVVLFVLTHTISSQRRKPHLASNSRPLSSPSDEPCPTQRKTKLGSAESAGIGSSRSCPQVISVYCGSMRITSNLHGWSELSWANGRNAGRCACASTATRLRANNFCCFGYLSSIHQQRVVQGPENTYSSNRRSSSAPSTQFCGHSPLSTYCWE